MDQRDLSRTEPARSLELDAPWPRLCGMNKAAVANAGAATVPGEELRLLHDQNAFRIILQLRVAFLIERMRGDRICRAAARGIGRGEDRRAVVIDFGHQTVGWRTGIAGQRAAFQDMADMVGQSRIDIAPDHVGREQRDVAASSGKDVLRATLQRRDQGMDSHLADDGALAQRIFIEVGTGAGRAQRSGTEFLDDDLRVEFGADHRDLGTLDAELCEHFLGDPDHPVEVAIASGHSAASENHRAADPGAGFDHMAEIKLDRFALEILGTGAEVIRAGIHRAAVADDGVDLASQGRFQRLFRVAVAECATGRDNAINELWHWRVPLDRLGQSGMVRRQRGRTNDPGRDQKQIWLRYAGIGARYGRSRHQAVVMLFD